jgi:hypothetical protein
LKLLDNFLNRRRRPRFLNMPVLATRAIRAKPHIIHAALLDVLGVVLEDAILRATEAISAEEVAYRQAVLVILVQVPAGFALHAQAPQPVPAHDLPEASATAALVMLRPDHGGAEGIGGRAHDKGVRAGFEGALEIEDEVAAVVVHFVGYGLG